MAHRRWHTVDNTSYRWHILDAYHGCDVDGTLVNGTTVASEQAQLGRLTIRRNSAESSEATKSRPPRRRREAGAAARVGALQVFVDELSASEPAVGAGGSAGGGAAVEGSSGPTDAARLATEVERLTAEQARCDKMWRDEAARLTAELELARSNSSSSWHGEQAGAEIERLAAELAAERTARVEAEARAGSAAQLLTQQLTQAQALTQQLTQVAYMQVCRPCGG